MPDHHNDAHHQPLNQIPTPPPVPAAVERIGGEATGQPSLPIVPSATEPARVALGAGKPRWALLTVRGCLGASGGLWAEVLGHKRTPRPVGAEGFSLRACY